MGFLTWLSPRFIKQQIADIDAEHSEQPRSHAWVVIGVACLCLLLVHYGKYSSNFREILATLDAWLSMNGEWIRAYRTSEYRELIGYLWWGSIHLLGFILLPMLVIRYGLRQRLNEFGWQWGRVHEHWPGYFLLTLPIMVFAIIASFGPEFSRHYPFYDEAHRSGFDLVSWEVIYITQFIAVEFFFRGFLVNGLRPHFGSLSVAVMCLPYLMLHFPKLWPESFGAILFGFFLGVLALMSRSIWGGVFVHVAIALTMDLAALIQTKGLPQQW